MILNEKQKRVLLWIGDRHAPTLREVRDAWNMRRFRGPADVLRRSGLLIFAHELISQEPRTYMFFYVLTPKGREAYTQLKEPAQ